MPLQPAALGLTTWRPVAWWLVLLVCVLQGCAFLPATVARSATFAFTDTGETPLARLVVASTPEAQPGLSGFRILPTGDYALDARLALARRAVRSIDAQYYQVHSDAVGHRFLRELRDAAARGVRVRLLVDDFYTTGHDAMLADLAAHSNVEVRLFNPLPSRAGSTAQRVLVSLHEFGRINHRMHNKLFVADNALAVSGGRNIGDEYFMSSTAANFIDLDVLAAGPIVRAPVRRLRCLLEQRAQLPDRQHRTGARRCRQRTSAFRPAGDEAELPANGRVLPRDMFNRPSVGRQLEAGRLELHLAAASVLVDSPDKVRSTRGQILNEGTAFFDAINLMRSARAEVVMASPYFIPGERGVDLMREAIGHGVRMSVLTNAADATDEPMVHFAYARYRHAMLRAGVQIYELGGHLVAQSSDLGTFRSSAGRLHAKVAVIDRRHVIIGSMNLDPRSARANTEVSLSIDSPALAGEILGLVERSGHLVGSYKLRLAADGDHIEWVARSGEREVVTRDEPGATLLSRCGCGCCRISSAKSCCSVPMDTPLIERRVRSYVLRAGRMGPGQQRALRELAPRYVLPFAEQRLDAAAAFGRAAPLILEVGFGMGDATVAIAAASPQCNFLGVEVHPPGVGALLRQIEAQPLHNVRIVQHDAVAVLEHMLAPSSLAGAMVFFPDPWPKKRHHKRRLIQPAFVALLASRLSPGRHVAPGHRLGAVCAARCSRCSSAEPLLANTCDGFAPRPAYRPLTKFEQRGARLGQPAQDLVFRKR